MTARLWPAAPEPATIAPVDEATAEGAAATLRTPLAANDTLALTGTGP